MAATFVKLRKREASQKPNRKPSLDETQCSAWTQSMASESHQLLEEPGWQEPWFKGLNWNE